MTDEEIKLRLAGGEDSRTQFKREPIGVAKLAAELTIEKMKAGVSVARNPLIFNFATKEMPYRGLGTGIQRALELGAKVDFVSDRELNVFKAIIFPSISASSSARTNVLVNVPVNVPVKQPTIDRVYQAIQFNPGINRKRLAALCELTEKTIGRQIKLLCDRIEFRGAPKTGGYYVVDEVQGTRDDARIKLRLKKRQLW